MWSIGQNLDNDQHLFPSFPDAMPNMRGEVVQLSLECRHSGEDPVGCAAPLATSRKEVLFSCG